MLTNNPYAQAGWPNPQNPQSINGEPWRAGLSDLPTFGILPPLDQRPRSVLKFEFTMLNPNILNCVVIGPSGSAFFEVRTTEGRTVISNPSTKFSIINWGQYTTVEGPCVGSKQRADVFLSLSSAETYRNMHISEESYIWIPRRGGTYLYNAGPYPPQEKARISLSEDKTKILLEIVSEAFQAGLFEPCIIATVLLWGGIKFD